MVVRYWSAGNGRGWPVDDVMAMLRARFGYPERPGYLWPWGAPFQINSGGPAPFIITCDPNKADIALLAGEDVAFLPNLMGPPQRPPLGYAEECVDGDPWLRGLS